MKPTRGTYSDELECLLYFGLACGITWALDAPLVLAWHRQTAPPDYALALVGLGAFGPSLAALLLAARRGETSAVFGKLRAPAGWTIAALLTPFVVQQLANLCELALGHAALGIRLQLRPELFAALVVFSLGEEFGWRGYAYPLLERRHGPVLASVLVGVMWGVWHLLMWFTPEGGAPTPGTFAERTVQLTLMSVVLSWLFERGGRGMAVALAFHAGGHLNKILGAPESPATGGSSRLLVTLILAGLAAHSLRARAVESGRASA